jgi:GNAT superfamily N-acetyltransferase
MKTANIRTMTTDDIVLGLRLSRQAGWNQTGADWLRLLYFEPEGCFVAELDGSAIGTTTTCVLGQVAWIAMVLVDESHRRRGIGTHLLRHALDHLDSRQVPTIRLDATELGRPVYEKLGFVPEYDLARYQGIAPSCQASLTVAEPTSDTYPDIIEFDKIITGTNREKMLIRLFEEFPQGLRTLPRQGKIEGYVTMRPGANAVQIGPSVAANDAGPALLCDALGRCAGKYVFLDIPLENTGAVRVAESSGLGIQRCFTRMYRGKKVTDTIEALWASSSPEKG